MYAIIFALALQAQISFAANGLPCGGNACASYYENIPGASVGHLKGAAKFPDSPESVMTLGALAVPEGHGEDYGVMVEAWVRAPQTGNYVFSDRSDDASEVWLATTAGVKQAEADMTKVVELTGCCVKVTGNTVVFLEEGKSYYLRGYMKEATGRDYFEIGMTVNGVEFFPISQADNLLGYVDPTGASCTSGSEFTEKMLVKMDDAQKNFGDCASDIVSIGGTVTNLSRISTVVDTAADKMAQIMKKVNDISDKILRPVSRGGLGIADTLGKIPKVGIFIKMGLKTVEKVIDGLDPLAQKIADSTDRIHAAVDVVGKVFLGLKAASVPTALYLKGSHAVLDAAHGCGLTTGYQCGTSSAAMEARNQEDYPDSKETLEEIALVGATCHDILSPMDAALEALYELARKIERILQPLIDVFNAVVEFIQEVDAKITEFVRMIEESDAAQCALEIFEPVTDVINLVTCPIDEVAGFVMHYVIGNLMHSVEQLINTATVVGMHVAVEALVPDNLIVHIPDFLDVIPVSFWVDTCEVAAIAFPGYATTVGEIMAIDLPITMTGQEIKDSILGDSLAELILSAAVEDYESACKHAWEEMGADFEHCEKVLTEIADALVDASCQAAVLVADAEVALVDAQQTVVDAALEHFEDAQREFTTAQDHLGDVQRDLDGAISSVEREKASCPRCRCGGCSWHDVNCHLEGVWCCPAKYACLGALEIAQAGVGAAKGTVSIAQGAVVAAQVTYNAASRELTIQQQVLRHHKQQADLQKSAMELICNPPAYEAITSGDCTSNGLQFIGDRQECILAGRLLGVTNYQNPQPSGNRQKWCGTWGQMTYLDFNTQTSGVGANNGLPIMSTANDNSRQICKRRGSGSLPAPTPSGVPYTVTVGNSWNSNHKTVSTGCVGCNLRCPVVVDKSNWLGSDTYGDRFSVTVHADGEVTVRRLDNTGGWGMNLQFTCTREPVAFTLTVGNTGSNSKTVSGCPGCGNVRCPAVVDKSNWLGTDTYNDRFAVTVSADGGQVTVRRLDNTGGWGMNLQFTCTADQVPQAPETYTKVAQKYCEMSTGHIWRSNVPSLAACKDYCTADSSCVAVSWSDGSCVLHPKCDQQVVSETGFEIHLKDSKKSLPSCKCASQWTSAGAGGSCGNTQSGCPATPCDSNNARLRSWCVVENPGCAGEQKSRGGQWFYCGGGELISGRRLEVEQVLSGQDTELKRFGA